MNRIACSASVVRLKVPDHIISYVKPVRTYLLIATAGLWLDKPDLYMQIYFVSGKCGFALNVF